MIRNILFALSACSALSLATPALAQQAASGVSEARQAVR